MAMLVDSGLTPAWRMHRRERWWQAHVQHAFSAGAGAGACRVCRLRGLDVCSSCDHAWRCIGPRASRYGGAGELAGVGMAWWRLHRTYDKNHTEGFGT
jgi:hypothetical protein